MKQRYTQQPIENAVVHFVWLCIGAPCSLSDSFEIKKK